MYTLEKIIIRMVGKKNYGFFEYLFFRNKKHTWGGAFNGQKGRLELFEDIIMKCSPLAIIETGTYIGTTTEILAEKRLPVFTIESNPRNYGFSKSRLRKYQNINIKLGDSRTELIKLINGPLNQIKNRSLFFYLDAHWKKDLPLGEEIEIIFSNCPLAVVMIDDFKVPMDPGYGYDNYGPGKELNKEYISLALDTYNLALSYPSITSADETGMKRGCAILCKKDEFLAKLTKCKLVLN